MSQDTHAPEAAAPALPGRFTGGARARTAFALVGVAGLALTLVGGLAQPQEALVSYLTAFVFWLGIALGGLLLVMIFHASAARWMVVLRRAMETISSSLPAFALLFIPLLLGARQLYAWVEPAASLGKEGLELVHHKARWLNTPWFTVRAVLYFAVFIAVSYRLWSLSHQQDVETDPARSAQLTRSQRKLSAGALPFVGLAMTFASFDWLMSLNPLFSSTIFGVYYFAGSFLAAIALLIIATAIVRHEPGTHGPHVSLAHFHNLGKLLLAFTAFWAYIVFSQYMLTWVANLPEELPWFTARTVGPWKPVWVALVASHFLIPFFTLLSRDLKMRPTLLAGVAAWILVAHFVDLWWIVVPTFHRDHVVFHWTQVTALAGVGGAAISFALFRLRGRYAVPVGDPYLPDSLRYSQP